MPDSGRTVEEPVNVIETMSFFVDNAHNALLVDDVKLPRGAHRRSVERITSKRQNPATNHVQPFPATGAKYTLSAQGFDTPHEVTWSQDGKELFFNSMPGGFESVSVTTHPAFTFGKSVAVRTR